MPGCTVQEWQQVRAFLQENRPALTRAAAGGYPVSRRVAGTSLLAGPAWIPGQPADLSAVRLDWRGPSAGPEPVAGGRPSPAGPDRPGLRWPASDGSTPDRASPGRPALDGTSSDSAPRDRSDWDGAAWNRAAWDRAAWDRAAAGVLPRQADGYRYRSYAAAVADLAPPALLENRPTYRLARARLAGSGPFLAFGPGAYFDSLDAGAACAHEYAALARGRRQRGRSGRGRLRSLAGPPWHLGRRPANLAIATLALRVDRDGATFPLHWRDPRRVGHAGGLLHVVPVGIFQAAGDDPGSQAADFDLWLCMQREFAEELAGFPEVRDPGGPGAGSRPRGGPLGERLSRARAAGRARPWVLGLGVDPLSLATDLLTVVAFDAPVFDDLFGAVAGRNDEGRVLGTVPFTAESVSRLAGREPVQAAGAALLRLAWRHRRVLLG